MPPQGGVRIIYIHVPRGEIPPPLEKNSLAPPYSGENRGGAPTRGAFLRRDPKMEPHPGKILQSKNAAKIWSKMWN